MLRGRFVGTWNCSVEPCASGKSIKAMRQMRLEPSTPRRPSCGGIQQGTSLGRKKWSMLVYVSMTSSDRSILKRCVNVEYNLMTHLTSFTYLNIYIFFYNSRIVWNLRLENSDWQSWISTAGWYHSEETSSLLALDSILALSEFRCWKMAMPSRPTMI